MKNVTALVCILLLLSITVSCSRSRRVVVSLETRYQPAIGDIATAEVGENMFDKTVAHFSHRNIVVLNEAEDRAKYRTGPHGNRFDRLDGAECALYNRGLSLLDYNCDGEFTHLRGGEELEKPVKYTLKPASQQITITRGSFKQEISYAGKIGNKINMLYREFYASDGKFMIRDAYTQNIVYELDEEGKALIGFKGLRIEIIEATNLNVTYRVISDFGS